MAELSGHLRRQRAQAAQARDRLLLAEAEVAMLRVEVERHAAAIRAVESVLRDHDPDCSGQASDFAVACDCTSGAVREALALQP